MSAKLFISCDQESKKFGVYIASLLEKDGMVTYLAGNRTLLTSSDVNRISDDDMLFQMIDNTISESSNYIKRCDCIIVLLTERYLRSQFLLLELNLIIESSRPIFIASIDGAVIPSYLAGHANVKLTFRSIESRERNVEDFSKDLVDSIRVFLLKMRSGSSANDKNSEVSSGDRRKANMKEPNRIPNSHFSNIPNNASTSFQARTDASDMQQSALDIGKQKAIESLKQAYREGLLTLVLGAGVSISAKIPDWSSLLEKMLAKAIANGMGKELDESQVKRLCDELTPSNLIKGKYLKLLLNKDFNTTLRKCLYPRDASMPTSPLIKAISKLATPTRNHHKLDSIITYNFDSLIEETLKQRGVEFQEVYKAGTEVTSTALPLYHVHGYIPRDGSIVDSDVVFSEDSYHTQFTEPYSWANLTQLNKFTNTVCLFIGISLTDPNTRRLLDISSNVRIAGKPTIKHFIFIKQPKCDDQFKQILSRLAEQDANALGLNVIWINDYNEIPDYLDAIGKC